MGPNRFSGQTVLVTGAASGIGLATAKRFAMEGADVVLTDIDADSGSEVTTDIASSAKGVVIFEELDVREFEAVSQCFAVIAEEYGLDIVVNNAGVVDSGALVEMSVAKRERLFDVNIRGVWNGCHAAITEFLDGAGGVIVNVASTAGLLGAPGLATYSMTKAAVVNFSRALAGEVGGDGIRVNAVCPGTIDTPMADADFNASDDPEAARDRAATATALGRIGATEEVAGAIAFLASADAGFVTGASLPVDGGTAAILRNR